MWSGFQGLYSRNAEGKKDQLVTRNPDLVAKLLLNPKATRKDLGNVEHIVAAMTDDALKEKKMSAFRADMAKEKA